MFTNPICIPWGIADQSIVTFTLSWSVTVPRLLLRMIQAFSVVAEYSKGSLPRLNISKYLV